MLRRFVSLQCPTCGAQLKIQGNQKQFNCEHCGNRYLLSQQADQIPAAERTQISPLTTFTDQFNQWCRAGEYEVMLRQVVEEKIGDKRVVLIDIEYQNKTDDVISCRSNQWVLFDIDGFTYSSFYDDRKLFGERQRPPLIGERFANPGGRVRGWLAFHVPNDVAIEKLQFFTAFLSTKTVEFTLQK